VNCDHVRPLLSLYLDGELDPAQRDDVAAHLTICQECARVLDDFRALGQDIRALPDAPAPREMRAEFNARLRRRSVFPSFGARLLASGASAVALVAVLIALTVGMSAVLRRMQATGQTARIVATYPPDGATGVPPDTNLTLTFGRPMDRASVESAIYIVPRVQLAFAWQGETLTVVPFVDWQPSTAYTLTVAGTAREESGALLEEPFVLRFETVAPETEPERLLNPIGQLGDVWRAELGGPDGPLGYAIEVEQKLWCAGQHFEHGLMMWLDQLYEDHIYVLTYGATESGGDWQVYVDTWREGDPESAELAPPEGVFEPIRGFGRLWREELGGPDAPVGWALEPEQGYTGSVQPFERGLMLWNPLTQAVYVLWDDSTWTVHPVSP
jgi:hypothetical protein